MKENTINKLEIGMGITKRTYSSKKKNGSYYNRCYTVCSITPRDNPTRIVATRDKYLPIFSEVDGVIECKYKRYTYSDDELILTLRKNGKWVEKGYDTNDKRVEFLFGVRETYKWW